VEYLWSNGDTTQTTTIYTSGDYSVTVTNEYGCKGNTNITVIITGIDDNLNSDFKMDIYPNPNQGSFWIIINEQLQGEFRYELLDANGRIIENNKLLLNGKLKQMVHPDYLPQGVYMLKTYFNNSINLKKVVVQ